MKKLKYLIYFFLFSFCVSVQADSISNYYIDYQVLENGDMNVRELIVLDGQYNGYERILHYRNEKLEPFDGSRDSFFASDIYNASDIEIIAVRFIPLIRAIDFDMLDARGVEGELVSAADIGDKNVYVKRPVLNGVELRLYNPSNLNKAFYIEYIIKDVAVYHEDIAEIKWNIFSDEQVESINNLQVRINLPNNQEEARIWGHGPLHGETKIENKETLLLKISDLSAQTPVDFRVVFDQKVVANSTKKTNEIALPIILEIEAELAEEANQKREAAQRRERYINYGLFTLVGIWGAYLIKSLLSIRKHNQPYRSTFNTKYFRDFPNEYNPTTVSYLLNQKVEKKDISAMILDLVERKVISYQKQGKEYVFSKNEGKFSLLKSEEMLLNFLFDDIGKKGQFTIKDINKYAKAHSQVFLNKYDQWWALATKEAKDHDFFYEKTKEEKVTMGLSLLGIILAFFLLMRELFFVALLTFIFGIAIFAFISKMKKRKKPANESYRRWIGLKNFLDDFGNFSERDLPKIELWGKYLVYAVVFGNANKLAKNMQIKFREVSDQGTFATDMFFIGTIGALNSSLSRGFSTSASSAQQIVSSSSSSAGGFGGGFSGGGGFGGGGGGGGRF